MAVAAISAGIIDGEARVDLPYVEDSQAEVDCNFVMTERRPLRGGAGDGGEGRVLGRAIRARWSGWPAHGMQTLFARQREALERARPLKVVLASRNRGKLREIVPLLAGLDFELCTVDEVAPDCELREDGDTFEANALAKARQAAAATGLAAIADDSGLEVDALGGAPGVYSARYAGSPPMTPATTPSCWRRCATSRRRSARRGFAAWRAFVDPGAGAELTCSGACEGEILDAAAGRLGFGYDPLFLVPALGRTMAELPLDEKNRLSHRAAAFRGARGPARSAQEEIEISVIAPTSMAERPMPTRSRSRRRRFSTRSCRPPPALRRLRDASL